MRTWKERVAEAQEQHLNDMIAELMPVIEPQGYTKPGQRGVDTDWNIVWVEIESDTDKLHIQYDYEEEVVTVTLCHLKDNADGMVNDIKDLVFQEPWGKVLKSLQSIKLPCPQCKGDGEYYDPVQDDYVPCELCDENCEVAKVTLIKNVA
jgi:hypothetical protein